MGYQTLQRRTFTRLGYIDDVVSINPDKAVDTLIGDQTTEIINLVLTRLIQSLDLTSPASLGDTTLTVSTGVQPTVGNIVCLKENEAFYQGEILSVVASGLDWDVTLDTPLDSAFTIAGGCSERSKHLNVDGSVTPVEFSISPANLSEGVEWDITRIIGTLVDDDAMDDSRFGGILGGLTKGVVVRYKDGVHKNIFNVKTNGEMVAQMYDVQYADKTPQGEYGLRFRRTFAGQSESGVAIRLASSSADALSVIVQDDLTGLLEFTIVAHGHRTDTPVS